MVLGSRMAFWWRYRTGKSFLLDLLARYLKVKAAETAKAPADPMATVHSWRNLQGPSMQGDPDFPLTFVKGNDLARGLVWC